MTGVLVGRRKFHVNTETQGENPVAIEAEIRTVQMQVKE